MAIFACGALGFGVIFAVGVLHIPGFGGDVHPYADRAVTAAVRVMTPNVVSSVNFDQRAFDTIGEELILFAAALGAVVLLRTVRAEEEDEAGEHSHGPA
jgi:multicomponent Na+:H+ antiporter subunit B